MVLIAVELHARSNLTQFTVNAYSQESFATGTFEEFLIMSLTIANEGSKEVDFMAFIIVKYRVDYLLFGIFHHRFARHIGVSFASTRVE